MTLRRLICRSMLCICLCMVTVAATAQQAPYGDTAYQPVERQAGKDVIWLPTALAMVEKMLDMAKVTSKDYVVDLGSGDGRTVITAAKRGARALGVEFNPDLVELSKRYALREGVADKAHFVHGDLFQADLSQATVITLFLLPEINYQLRPKILDLKPGTRVVSNTFDMSDWTADQISTIDDREKCPEYCTVLLWIVPAKVAGSWKLGDGELIIEQKFQTLTGRLNRGAEIVPLKDGRLNGDQISFTAGGARYNGRVAGDQMHGTFLSGRRTTEWAATRISKAAQSHSR